MCFHYQSYAFLKNSFQKKEERKSYLLSAMKRSLPVISGNQFQIEDFKKLWRKLLHPDFHGPIFLIGFSFWYIAVVCFNCYWQIAWVLWLACPKNWSIQTAVIMQHCDTMKKCKAGSQETVKISSFNSFYRYLLLKIALLRSMHCLEKISPLMLHSHHLIRLFLSASSLEMTELCHFLCEYLL